MDTCHTYTSTYQCHCGATLAQTAERDLVADPYSMVWMEPAYVQMIDRDERGRFVKPHVEEVVCFRCRELQGGAKPAHVTKAVFADGTTWTMA